MKFTSKPIHTLSNRLSTEDPSLELDLPRHIGHYDSQEHRKQTRGRRQEQDAPYNHERDGEHIFENTDWYADHCGLSVEPVIALRIGKEVFRHTDDEPGCNNSNDEEPDT